MRPSSFNQPSILQLFVNLWISYIARVWSIKGQSEAVSGSCHWLLLFSPKLNRTFLLNDVKYAMGYELHSLAAFAQGIFKASGTVDKMCISSTILCRIRERRRSAPANVRRLCSQMFGKEWWTWYTFWRHRCDVDSLCLTVGDCRSDESLKGALYSVDYKGCLSLRILHICDMQMRKFYSQTDKNIQRNLSIGCTILDTLEWLS